MIYITIYIRIKIIFGERLMREIQTYILNAYQHREVLLSGEQILTSKTIPCSIISSIKSYNVQGELPVVDRKYVGWRRNKTKDESR